MTRYTDYKAEMTKTYADEYFKDEVLNQKGILGFISGILTGTKNKFPMQRPLFLAAGFVMLASTALTSIYQSFWLNAFNGFNAPSVMMATFAAVLPVTLAGTAFFHRWVKKRASTTLNKDIDDGKLDQRFQDEVLFPRLEKKQQQLTKVQASISELESLLGRDFASAGAKTADKTTPPAPKTNAATPKN